MSTTNHISLSQFDLADVATTARELHLLVDRVLDAPAAAWTDADIAALERAVDGLRGAAADLERTVKLVGVFCWTYRISALPIGVR